MHLTLLLVKENSKLILAHLTLVSGLSNSYLWGLNKPAIWILLSQNPLCFPWNTVDHISTPKTVGALNSARSGTHSLLNGLLASFGLQMLPAPGRA